jgi:hypothetical protein
VFCEWKNKGMSLVNDTVVTTAAAVGLGVVLIGGVYYMLPSWQSLPGQSDLEDLAAGIATAPLNVAAKIGTNLGDSFMSAMGYEYSPEQLRITRERLFAEVNIPNTPANAAQIFYEIMLAPGRMEQLRKARIDILGGTDVEWNKAVNTAYYPMFEQRLPNAINAYMASNN